MKKQKTKLAHDEKIERINFEAPASLKKALKLKLAQDDKTLKDVGCYLLESYVKGKIKLNGV